MKDRAKVQSNKMTPEMLELADAATALDNIEGALHAASAALKHFTISPEDKARIGVAVAVFADALTQHDVPLMKKKRIGKNALRSRLRDIAAKSGGVLEPLSAQA